MADGCECRCHNWPRGTQRACYHAGHYMTAFDWAQRASVWEYHMQAGVSTSDVVEAALACKVCIDFHCGALSGPPPALRPRPPRERAEYIDDQADGAK